MLINMKTIFLFVFILYVKAQWIQLNLDSKNDFYLNALSAGDSYMRKSQSKNEDISRVALYTMNESYNQRFKIVYSKRNSDNTIKFCVIEMYCGKSTSGMFKIGQTYMYDDEIEFPAKTTCGNLRSSRESDDQKVSCKNSMAARAPRYEPPIPITTKTSESD